MLHVSYAFHARFIPTCNEIGAAINTCGYIADIRGRHQLF